MENYMAKKVKYVYFFGGKKADGKAEMKSLLGGKGANLAEMVNIGLPVPAGYTITTEVCTYYYANKRSYPKELKAQVLDALKKVENAMGAKFGDPKNPLLVSIRSGARASMPGMMDTILNLGLNDTTVKGVIEKTNGNTRFAYDSYRRFVQMYGDVVLGLKPVDKHEIDPFEAIIEAKKEARGIHFDTELTAEDLMELVAEFKAAIKEKTGHDFPEDPHTQLWGAIGAVFGSWMNDRAKVYRKLNGIPESWGTAVNVQSMVFGNMYAIPLDAYPAERAGFAISVLTFCYGVMQAVISPWFGAVIDRFGYAPICVGASLTPLAGWWLLRRLEPPA